MDILVFMGLPNLDSMDVGLLLANPNPHFLLWVIVSLNGLNYICKTYVNMYKEGNMAPVTSHACKLKRRH